jgi:hypothetical protein
VPSVTPLLPVEVLAVEDVPPVLVEALVLAVVAVLAVDAKLLVVEVEALPLEPAVEVP